MRFKLIDAIEKIPENAGVYIIRWVKGGRPLRIPRLLGVDENGILYIGCAKNVKTRLKRLFKGIRKPRPKIHSMSLTYHFFGLDKYIDVNEMEVACIEFKNKEQAKSQECAILKYYAKKYGETPIK